MTKYESKKPEKNKRTKAFTRRQRDSSVSTKGLSILNKLYFL